jgi:hypothetical protein
MSLWKKAHELKGNECDIITMYRNPNQPNPGICLDLPLISTDSKYLDFRHKYYQIYRGELGDYKEREGFPPAWEANSIIEKSFFKIRDWVWSFYIEDAIKKYNLYNYDIYHFEWGLDFYRDCRFAKELSKRRKPIVCTYHGQDMRTRGVISELDQISNLNLTSEVDLLYKHPNIEYLFLPYETGNYNLTNQVSNRVKVCHSPTNRYYKGSEDIIKICRELEKEDIIEFLLIEGKRQDEVVKIKQECDIYIDQIHNRGGWGYGMSSVESLSMGLVCMTELLEEYKKFIPDHPFIAIDKSNIRQKIIQLTEDKEMLLHKKSEGQKWVTKYHGIKNVVESLYSHYEKLSWIK